MKVHEKRRKLPLGPISGSVALEDAVRKLELGRTRRFAGRLYPSSVGAMTWVLCLYGTASPSTQDHTGRWNGKAPAGLPARYIVLALNEQGVARPQAHRRVQLAALPASRSEEEVQAWLQTPSSEADMVAIRLLDSSGAVVFRDVARVPRWLRVEKGLGDGGDGPSRGDPVVMLRNPAFVARVPLLPFSRILVSTAATRGGELRVREEEWDLEALAADPDLPLARFLPKSELVGAPVPVSANRVDLLVMGDGYTAGQSQKFTSDAESMLASFFALTPLGAYRNLYEEVTLFTASSESGADHPPYVPDCTTPPSCCADPTMEADPLQGTFVSTAFDATFCGVNLRHYLIVDVAKVLVAAAAYPDWDTILMIVNDEAYGGSAQVPVAVASLHPAAVLIAQHEFAHSFARLADEYDDFAPGQIICSDISGPACEPNVTDQTDRSALKWGAWVLPTTPIPTPDEPPYDAVVGLFEGARYTPTGMYRSRRNCMMRDLFAAPFFCEICAQEFVLRLYRGGWGVPSGCIDMIEPGSESPAPGPVSLTFPGSRTFAIALLQPVGAPPLAVTWAVDGTIVPGATASSYTFVAPAPGRYEVVLTVRDETPLVHPAMAGSATVRSRSWTVDVIPSTVDLAIAKGDDGPAAEGQALVYTIVATNAGPDAAAGAMVSDVLPPQLTASFWTCVASTGSSCPASGSGNVNAAVSLLPAGSATFTVTGTVVSGGAGQIVNTASVSAPAGFTDTNTANNTASLTTPVLRPAGFYTVGPCRLADTRVTDAPSLSAGTVRILTVAGRCHIPTTASAVSVNVTVTQPTAAGNVRLYRAGIPVPLVSTVNYSSGQTRGNNAVVPLNEAGFLAVYCNQASGTVDLVLDVNGYFE